MAKGNPDYILIAVTAILIILGIIILANVSAPFSLETFGTTYYFLNHQLLFGLFPGLILAFLTFRIPLDFLKKWVPLLLLINLILLAIVFLPGIGFEFRGAARWINLGPISFQPSEFLKLTFILYLAAWLASRTASEKTSRNQLMWGYSQTFLAFLIVIGVISLLLIFQPDISTLGIIILVASLMYFLAKTPLWQNFLIIFIGVASLFILIKLAPYRAARFLVFFDPTADPMGIGYQIKQALIAAGSGGIFGLGLGMSQMKFGFLPQSIADSIFAIFAEETGFIGSTLLIFLFLVFFWRGFRIGKLSQDKFSQLTAWGITIWICLQSFINIAAMIKVLPLTGIPLSFISYGGSSLVAELGGVGILLNISRQKV
ncbi:MAG: putative lipid II flippase FtsW [Patescibacteria group bacterium]|nr:putative lipid II flippase FtsW [Patescibacteria group bacterium]